MGGEGAYGALRNDSDTEGSLTDDKKEFAAVGWRHEGANVARLGSSVAAIQFGRVMTLLTDVAMLGHLGSEYLAAAATGNIWMNITMFVVWRSLATVLRNLTSAAIGADNPKQAGVWLQVALFIGACLMAIIASLWAASESIFEHIFRMNSPDSHRAALFVRYSSLWLPPQIIFLIVNNFFQSMQIVKPAIVVTYIFLPVNAALNLFLIWGLPGTSWDGLGFIGGPLATTITRWLQCSCFLIYMLWYRKAHEQVWGGWSMECFSSARLGRFLKLGAPLALSGLFEEAQLQTIAIMAVHMGSEQIAAHATVLNIFICLTAFVMGLRAAVNIRISHYFGKGDAVNAKMVAKLGLTAAVGIGTFIMAVSLATRSQVGKLFTNDTVVQNYVKDLMLLMSFSYVFMGIFLVVTIILMSAHKTGLVAVIFLTGAWFVGIPMAYVFGFVLDHGVKGLWEGLIMGYTTMLAVGSYFALRIDYEKTAAMVHEIARSKVGLRSHVNVNQEDE
eukprot:TRINITY_DN22910_c0_g1_i1.p1 TRINITY_DN22910_c0_g1~~TRINITY_DN22910_c0_g1_i1.p1  ORF type:complete len:502 (+),score=135.76 TRINITY_DN22910_c0_g1_i1:34-1539(+)